MLYAKLHIFAYLIPDYITKKTHHLPYKAMAVMWGKYRRWDQLSQ